MKSLNSLKEVIEAYPLFNSPLFLKYKHLVIPGVVLISGLLIAFLVTVPQMFKLFETFKQINDLTMQRDALVKKTETLQSLDVEQYKENLETALIALPVDKNIPGVTGELLVALSGGGMTLEGISVSGGGVETSGKSEEFALRMDITGSEESLKNFLERVKALPRIIKMTSIEISANRNNTLSASIDLATVYQSLPENIGAVDSPVPILSEDEKTILGGIESKAQALPQVSAPGTGEPVSVEGKDDPFSP